MGLFSMRIMNIFIALSLVISSASVSAQTYEVEGKVVSVVQHKGDTRCHVAIKDPGNQYVSGAYHFVDGQQMCAMANAAFVAGASVRGYAHVEPKGGMNELYAIGLYKSGE
jgi:hypothetical protein